MFTSAFPARRNATRISSSDTVADLISPARGNPTATRWNTVQNSNFIIRRSSDRPRSHIAAARRRASSTLRMVFTPAMRYDLLVFLELDVGEISTCSENFMLVSKLRPDVEDICCYNTNPNRKIFLKITIIDDFVAGITEWYSKTFFFFLKSRHSRQREPKIIERCRPQSTL